MPPTDRERLTSPEPSVDAGAPSPPVAQGPPWNVLLITVDSLRADMPWAGYPRDIAPSLTKLAERCVVVPEHRAIASSTPQSIAALLSGRYASTLYRSGYFFAEYSQANEFFAELLADRYIPTTALHAHHYLRPGRKGLDQGFTRWEMVPNVGYQPGSMSHVSSAKATDRLVELLTDPRVTREPFFAWAHYMDPHDDQNDDYTKHESSPDFGNQPRDRYDSEVFFTDHHIGRLVDWARTMSWWPRTALIVTADHGEAFGERGALYHAYELWESLVRVPFIACVPGAPARTLAAAHTHIDVAPTILELMGIAVPDGLMQGRSMLPEILGRESTSSSGHPILLEIAPDSGQQGRRAIVDGRWKLVVRTNEHGSFQPLLFDLSQDRWEAHDRSEDHPEEVVRLTAALEQAFASLPDVTPYGGMRLVGAGRATGTHGPSGARSSRPRPPCKGQR